MSLGYNNVKRTRSDRSESPPRPRRWGRCRWKTSTGLSRCLHRAGFWRQWRAFAGPAILVSVGYMDPGNWGTDLAGGARFKYGLLWVVGVASIMAIFCRCFPRGWGWWQGRILAQCCRDWYPAGRAGRNWLLCELAIAACDLAEVLGSAVR